MLARENKFTLPQGMAPTLFTELHGSDDELEISDVVDVSSGTRGGVAHIFSVMDLVLSSVSH